jgi:TPR repeat protein
MGHQIFISYRRDDSAGYAGRVHDRLEREFGADLLFMDVDSIPLGLNFVKILREKIARCDVLLAVIGPSWIDVQGPDGKRRLDDPSDFVRVEIAAALEREIPVIPILLNGAKIPSRHELPDDLKELAVRQGLDVRHASFHGDMNRLILRLKGPSAGGDIAFPSSGGRHVGKNEARQSGRGGARTSAAGIAIAAAGLMTAMGLGFGLYFWLHDRQPATPSVESIAGVGRPRANDKDKDAVWTANPAFKAALERKAYDEAYALAWPRAAGGDRDAQFALGWFFDRGNGIEPNEEQAALWYEKAAAQGHRSAQFNLATLYEYGAGVPKSDTQALYWYRKAAEQGDAEAQNNVGIFYAMGRAVPRDDAAAVMWYEKAAKQNYTGAEKNLGDMYMTGRGVKQDDREAFRLYQLAAGQKNAAAAYNIGYMYENGRGFSQPDYEAAARWYAKAADYGSAKAREALDQLRKAGRIKG